MADQPITVHWEQSVGGLIFVYICLQACEAPGKFFGIGFETSYRLPLPEDANPRSKKMWSQGIEERVRSEANSLLTSSPGSVLGNYLLRIGELSESLITNYDVMVVNDDKWKRGIEELKKVYKRSEASPFSLHRDKWPEPKAVS